MKIIIHLLHMYNLSLDNFCDTAMVLRSLVHVHDLLLTGWRELLECKSGA